MYSLVLPTLDRRQSAPSPFVVDGSGNVRYDYSGQFLSWSDPRGRQRWNSLNTLLASWADQHIVDQRYNFCDDDDIQLIYPECESPWKFPDLIYITYENIVAPELEGLMIEPQYFDPDPTMPPSGVMYKVNEPALPEHNMRVGAVEVPVSGVQWGPAHNIPKNMKMLMAPFDWLGSVGPTLGETWETFPAISASGSNIADYQGVTSLPNVETYQNMSDRFPANPLMPHGDPDPLWNDGLDPQRLLVLDDLRRTSAHLRGSNDRWLMLWGQLTRPSHVSFNWDTMELEVTDQEVANETTQIEQQIRHKLDFRQFGGEGYTWADPAGFNEVNMQNFHRGMTFCSLCFKKDKCKASNSAARAYLAGNKQPEAVEGKTGSWGFVRNHYVDVPESLNPDTHSGKVYAHSFCQYSTGSRFNNTYARPSTDSREEFVGLTDLEDAARNYDYTSDLCHIYGMPRRTVEYYGHYKLLLDEVSTQIYNALSGIIDAILSGALPNSFSFPLKNNSIGAKIVPAGLSYDGFPLYKIVSTETWQSTHVAGQYGTEYAGQNDCVIAWLTVRYSKSAQSYFPYKVWAYIWYVSAHTDKANRVKIKRLVEMDPQFGSFEGNAVEGKSAIDFSGGHMEWQSVPWTDVNGDPKDSVWRGCYKQIEGVWVWVPAEDHPYDLSTTVANHRDPSGCCASGIIEVKSLPGEIIPKNALAYVPPKVIKWGKSKTDPSTQTNVGSTRYWYDLDSQRWLRETGDIDDLYYHIEYLDPLTQGFMIDYRGILPQASGFYLPSPLDPSGDPTPSSYNTAMPLIPIGAINPYNRVMPSGWEPNTLDKNDLLLASDLQHARNMTAPIFAYDLTTEFPIHHVIKPEFYIQRMDWCRREWEPIQVAGQRLYGPTTPIWTYAQNPTNRERFYNLNTGWGPVEGADGEHLIKRFWMPEGRVWWNRKGILGCMIEKDAAGDLWYQKGIAVANLWRKYLPHHMEVVRAYLFLQPTQEHHVAPRQIGTRYVPGFDPFEGIGIQYDNSTRKVECRSAMYWAFYAMRIHNANQFLGGRIVGADVNAQLDSQSIWDVYITDKGGTLKFGMYPDQTITPGYGYSYKVVGRWNFPGHAPIEWSPGGEYSIYDMFHQYDRSGLQSPYFLLDGMEVKLNGEQIYSVDPEQSSTVPQRSIKWYTIMEQLYADGGAQIQFSESTPQYDSDTPYYNNSNTFTGINTSKDAGEGDNAKPSPLGKGYGFSKRGGGWKARYIYDITPQVKKAHESRLDATFITRDPLIKKQETMRE